MLVNLIKIGNSKGIRLPKAIIDQLNLEDHLDLEIENEAIVIRPAKQPRSGWARAAAQCHSAGEDSLDDWDTVTSEFPEDIE